jgi:hypothetical protein
MRTLIKPIPANNNAAGSGAPFDDVVKSVDALTEIRSVVPNTAADVGAAAVAAFNILVAKMDNLEKQVTYFQ